MKHIRACLALCLAIALCAVIASADDTAPLKSGIDPDGIDTHIKPGDDFFAYVNGIWIKNNPIPADATSWNGFSTVHERNTAELREILDDLAKADDATGERRQLRDFYRTAMDETKLYEQGATPLAADLGRIAKIGNADELVALLGELRGRGVGFVFGLGVDQDEKQSTRYVVHLYQGGLGLPEREYYLGTSEDSKKIRGQYVEHITRMLSFLGDKPDAAAASAAAVMRIETALAEASRKPVALRDAEANYNKKTLAELAKLTPNLKWDGYFKAIGAAGVEDVIVGQPEFFQKMDAMLKSSPIADWQAYLRWHLLKETADYLSPAIEHEQFHFYGEILHGQKKIKPRWKRSIEVINRQMGEALGKLYVEKYFPPSAKKRMDDLVQNVKAAYQARIETRDWMSLATRKQALIKLNAIVCKIGYPAKWRDYRALEIKPDSYVGNVLRSRAFHLQYEIAKLGKPIDRDEWGMTPPTVNAYYNGSMNEIVFPAGILQPPFFDPKADDAVNYGAIGVIIGHEMTHGFDDQGSRSDAEGNLKDWWTAADRAAFDTRTARLAKQFDACVPIDDLHINGRLTLGENLADLGGVNIAYDAYIKSLNGKPAPVLDGFTGPQRFFLGFAQSWHGANRDAEARVRLRTDPHSPGRFRVLMPLSNVQHFYDAFDVKPGDAMYRKPADRVEVW